MIRRLIRFTPPPGRVARDQLFINLEILLKIQRLAHRPFLMPRQRSQILPAVCRRVFLRHRSWLRFCRWLVVSGDHFHRVHACRDQRFSLQQLQQIAIQRGVHLQAVPSMFHHIGIHKPRHDAFALQRFGQLRRQLTRLIRRWLFYRTHQASW